MYVIDASVVDIQSVNEWKEVLKTAADRNSGVIAQFTAQVRVFCFAADGCAPGLMLCGVYSDGSGGRMGRFD